MTITLLGSDRPTRGESNAVYRMLNSLVVRVFDDFDGPTMHESCYVPTPMEHASAELEDVLAAPDILKSPLFGCVEADLLNFLMASTVNNVLALVGSVGSGKSSIICNLKHLILTHRQSCPRCIPVRINFNAKRQDLVDARASGEDELRAVAFKFVRAMVAQTIDSIVLRDIDAFASFCWDNEAFFASYRTGWHLTEPEHRNEYRASAFEAFRDSSDRLDAVVRYVSQLGFVVALFLDNVDPLDRTIHEALLWLAEAFREHRGVRIIVCMRDNTRNALASSLDALSPLYVEIGHPDIPRILQQRAKFLVANTAEFKVKETIRKSLAQLGLQSMDAAELLTTFIDAALPDPVLRTIHDIANRNARLALAMARTYLSSPYIHSDKLASVMKSLHAGQTEVEIPAQVVVRSVVTENYLTYRGESRFPTIVNIWSNTPARLPASLFIRLYLLHLIEVQGPTTTPAALGHHLQHVFGRIPPHAEYFAQSLRPTLLTLTNAWLVRTPDFLITERANALGADSQIELTPAGQFYLRELAYRLDYFGYIKDTITLARKLNAVSCLTAVRFLDRFWNSLIVAQHLYEQELEWCRSIREADAEAWARFKQTTFRDADGAPQLVTSRFGPRFRQVRSEHPAIVTEAIGRRSGELEELLNRANREMFSEVD